MLEGYFHGCLFDAQAAFGDAGGSFLWWWQVVAEGRNPPLPAFSPCPSSRAGCLLTQPQAVLFVMLRDGARKHHVKHALNFRCI